MDLKFKQESVQDSNTGRQRRKVIFEDEQEIDQGYVFPSLFQPRYFAKKPKNAQGGINSAQVRFPESPIKSVFLRTIETI